MALEFKFDAATFEMIQNLAFPLIASLTGFDAAAWAGEQSELFIKVGEGFTQVSELFITIGTALQDGKLTAEEIEGIIAEAKDIPAALDSITAFFGGDEEPE